MIAFAERGKNMSFLCAYQQANKPISIQISYLNNHGNIFPFYGTNIIIYKRC